jgi:hypothetical protein
VPSDAFTSPPNFVSGETQPATYSLSRQPVYRKWTGGVAGGILEVRLNHCALGASTGQSAYHDSAATPGPQLPEVTVRYHKIAVNLRTVCASLGLPALIRTAAICRFHRGGLRSGVLSLVKADTCLIGLLL